MVESIYTEGSDKRWLVPSYNCPETGGGFHLQPVPCLKSASSTWVSQPGSPHEELRVTQDVPLLITNVASCPIWLEAGEVLSDLEPAELIENCNGRSEQLEGSLFRFLSMFRLWLVAWIRRFLKMFGES